MLEDRQGMVSNWKVVLSEIHGQKNHTSVSIEENLKLSLPSFPIPEWERKRILKKEMLVIFGFKPDGSDQSEG